MGRSRVSERVGAALVLLLLLVLPLAALLARRLPTGTVLRYAAIWVAGFAILFGFVALFT
jgi:hypothetical protein